MMVTKISIHLLLLFLTCCCFWWVSVSGFVVGVGVIVLSPIVAPGKRLLSAATARRCRRRRRPRSTTNRLGVDGGATADSSGDYLANKLLEWADDLLSSTDEKQKEKKEQQQFLLAALRAEAGKYVTLIGGLGSMTESLVAHPTKVSTMLYEGYNALYNYTETSGALQETEGIANLRYAENKALLGVIQKVQLADGGHRTDDMLADGDQNKVMKDVLERFPMEEARRYVKFAVAAYGDVAIKATKLDTYHEIDWRVVGEWTKQLISEHVNIPEQDLVITDTEYDGDPDLVRHFVALDRIHKKVILAIRGTFTHQEVMIDLNGYSRPFYGGGESHTAISIMTERLWEHIGDDIIQLLHDNEGYELIVTGHSLGGGSATLLNIMLHHDPRMVGHTFRTFAYAAPPGFVPLSNIRNEIKTAINYIHQYDDVPFLSGDSIRHQIAAIAAVDEATQNMSLEQRARLLLGLDEPDPELVTKIHSICRQQPLLPEIDGLPRGMAVPVCCNVWLWEDTATTSNPGTYIAKLCDSEKMAECGIFVHKDGLNDHLPARYEYVFENLQN